MELHSSWKWVVSTKLQLGCDELHHIYSELQGQLQNTHFSHSIFVPFTSLVIVANLCMPYYYVTIWICIHFLSKSPWFIIWNYFYEDNELNLVTKLWHLRFLFMPSSTISFLNLLNWLKLLISKCLALSKMNKCSTI
jgi:hypothetical protein